MIRLLRIRLPVLLLALAAIPIATLPFAEQLRSEWAKFWEPEVEELDGLAFDPNEHIVLVDLYFCPTDYSNATTLSNAPPADLAWDVDSDAGGVQDAVWIDLGPSVNLQRFATGAGTRLSEVDGEIESDSRPSE